MITYIIPTRDRPEVLERTLLCLGALGAHAAEVIVVDNASRVPASVPSALRSGVPVRSIRLTKNVAAAARNIAAEQASERSEWLVMLDDDSYPLHPGFVPVLAQTPGDVGAVGAEIFLPPKNHDGPADMFVSARASGSMGSSGINRGGQRALDHEQGGLPEVFIGCGVAIRRGAFLKLGGYDARFDYYAEEYDLCARLILSGYRVVHDRRFCVMHHKITRGRDFSRIARNLVRNNCWVAQRYAPEALRAGEVQQHLSRYRKIAWMESATWGYVRGLADVALTLHRQVRTPMNTEQWERFIGLDACRRALGDAARRAPLGRVRVVSAGKNEAVVRRALAELGASVAGEKDKPDTLVIGTMSPGPALDALEKWDDGRKRVVVPMIFADQPVSASLRAG